jgi:2'-5' RNA ligase
MAAAAFSSATGPTLRTFVAVELPPPVQAAIAAEQARLQTQLRGAPAALRWTAAESIHLTLRFLGDTTAAQRAQLVESLRAETAAWPVFTLRVGGLGCFPDCRAPRVVWLDVDGDLAALAEVQRQVETLVQQAGFAPEERPFSPHLTVARARRDAARGDLQATGRALVAAGAGRPAAAPVGDSFAVDHIIYFQSELRPGGSLYTPLATIAWGG